MAGSIAVSGATRREQYKSLLPQIKSLVEGETDLTANLANIVSALKYGMGFYWVGFYCVQGQELVLGPFQGPVACTRIGIGKGVCGKAWIEKSVIIVQDVDEFPGHIACSSESKSEIVLPVLDINKNVVMVLDADSNRLADFDETDRDYLQQVVSIVENLYAQGR